MLPLPKETECNLTDEWEYLMLQRLDRFIVLFVLAFSIQFGFAARQASAQSVYNFQFASSIGSGSIYLILGSGSGNPVTGAFGGTGIMTSAALSTSNNPFGLGTAPALNSVTTAPFFGQFSTTVYLNTGTYTYALNGGASDNIYKHDDSQSIDTWVVGAQGIPFTMETMTYAGPAPVPGAGTLSWLVLGLGIVIIRRKTVSAAVRSAYARIAGRASA